MSAQNAPVPTDAPVVTRKELVQALAPYVVPDTRKGVLLLLSDVVVLGLMLALALLADHPALRALGAVLAGFKMTALYTLAHDAAHGSLTRSRKLNKLLAICCYTPLLFNYRLWLHDHNATHHPGTNGPQKDAYTPMSYEAYRKASWWRRAWERFGRSGNPLSFAPYYFFGRYAEAKFIPTGEFPAEVRKQAWPYVWLGLAYLCAQLTGVALYSSATDTSFLLNASLVVVVPLVVFQTLLALTLYLQHTHPLIPWFLEGDPRRANYGQEALTVRLTVPRVLGALAHDPFSHAAHHVLPAIPCYRIYEAQTELSRLIGSRSIDVPFLGLPTLRRIFRHCKLYDYENHQWLDFNGKPSQAWR